MKQQKLLAALLSAAAPFASYAATETDTLREIVVTATRIEQPLAQSLQSTTVITSQDIQASPAVDVPGILKNLAGIEMAQSGGIGQQSSLYLRGANFNQVLVLLDGARIGSATTGATAIDQLMLDQIERIEIVRGNVSSLYGSDAIGGVVQIFTKSGHGSPAFHASAGAGTRGTQRAVAGFGGESGNTRFNLEASKFKTDGVSAINPAVFPNANPDNNGYDNLSFSGNVHHAFNTEHSLAISAFNSQGNASFDNAYGMSTDVNTSRSQLSKISLASDNRLMDNWQSHLQWSDGQDDSRNALNGVQSSTFKTSNRQIAWQNTVSLNDANSLLLGLENLNQQVSGSTAFTQTSRNINSLFGGYTGNFGAHQLQVNLRQDRHPGFGEANTGLLGYGYAVNGAWRATASISTAFKAPTFNDLYYPLSYGYQGNPNLQPERSYNSEIGIHYALAGQKLDAVYFSNRIQNLIAINANFSTMTNIGQARNDGVEISYQGKFGNTGVTATLTSQDTRDETAGQPLLKRSKLFGSLAVNRQFENWDVRAGWIYSDVRQDSYSDPVTFATVRTTLPAYNVFNLAADCALNKKLKLSLRADNLTGDNNAAAYGYNSMGRTFFAGLSYRQ